MMYILLATLVACGPKKEDKTPIASEQPIATEKSTEATSPPRSNQKGNGSVILDGSSVRVYWDDGDTFAFYPDGQKKKKARLNGLNSLESYGPVHQWGEWTEQELYVLSKKAGEFARSKEWTCTDTQKGGGYGRILVDCPDFRIAILEEGLAHPFSVGGPAPAEDIAAMNKAIAGKKGMWEKGVPTLLISSLHSQDEKADKNAYNRVCVVETGECKAQEHTETYQTCQKICEGDSCMTYVPYKQRYGENRADCLK